MVYFIIHDRKKFLLEERFVKNGFLPHANLIIGNVGTNLDKLKRFLEKKLNFVKIESHPDCFVTITGSLGVNDSRKIKEAQSKKALAGDKRVFIIGAEFFTLAAQNSLLKTIEEPIENHFFFILASSANKIIPTLRSRLATVEEKCEPNNDVSFVSKFVNADILERLKMVNGIIEKTKEESPTFNENEATSFINDLENYFYLKITNDHNDRKSFEFLNKLKNDRKYLKEATGSSRLVLEHISFICPGI